MILHTDDVNTQVDIFNSNFNKCLNECAPFVTKEVRKPVAPWMNDNIQIAINIRDNIHKTLKSDRHNPKLQEKYKHEKKKKAKSIIEMLKLSIIKRNFNKIGEIIRKY